MRSVSLLLLGMLVSQADGLQVGSTRVTTRRNVLAALPLVAAVAPAFAAAPKGMVDPTAGGMEPPQLVLARAVAGDTVKASAERAEAEKAAKREAELAADARKERLAAEKAARKAAKEAKQSS